MRSALFGLIGLLMVNVGSPPRGAGGQQPVQDPEMRAMLERRLERAKGEYSLEDEYLRLSGYIREISNGFGGPVPFTAEPIEILPAGQEDRLEFLSSMARVAVWRFGIRPESVRARFVGAGEDTAGRTILQSGHVLVEVADRYVDDDERIIAAVAHQLGHTALELRARLAESRDDDEFLADAAAVMAGYGRFMLRAAYRERVWVEAGETQASIERTGYLHPVALAYLTLVQADIAGATAAVQRRLVGDAWVEPAWSFRQARLREVRVTRDPSSGAPRVLCPTCATPVVLPPGTGPGAVQRCPVCAQALRPR